jgi:hypothetical protein
LRGIIVVIQGVVKLYVIVVEAFTRKERHGEIQKTIKMNGILSFNHPRPNPLPPFPLEC